MTAIIREHLTRIPKMSTAEQNNSAWALGTDDARTTPPGFGDRCIYMLLEGGTVLHAALEIGNYKTFISAGMPLAGFYVGNSETREADIFADNRVGCQSYLYLAVAGKCCGFKSTNI